MHEPDPGAPIQWNAYPALFLTACLALGIAVADYTAFPVHAWLAGGTATVALLALVHTPVLGRLPALLPAFRTGAACIMAFVIGGAAFQSRYTPAGNDVSHVLGRLEPGVEITVTGRVQQSPVVRGRTLRLTLDVRQAGTDAHLQAASGRVLVRLRQPAPTEAPYPEVQIGDVIRLTAIARPVLPCRNPADFDYQRYLALKGIRHILTVEHPDDVRLLGRERVGWERIVLPVKAYAAGQIERFVPGRETRLLVKALVLGDRSVLDEETEEDFRRTGLTHLLAVSGTHMVFVGLVLYALLGSLLTRMGAAWRVMERSRFVLTTAVLVVYTLLTGGSASAVRAAIMVVLFMGGAVLQRTAHALNGLGVAAVILLLIDSAALYDIGFQLSFAAVAGLVLLHPVFTGWLPEGWHRHAISRAVVTMTSTSAAATLATAPVLLLHFGSVPIGGLLLNIPAIPITALVMSAGLAVIATGPLGSIAAAFGSAADVTASWLLHTAHVGDDLLGKAAWEAPSASGWSVAALAWVVLALAAWGLPRLRWRLSAAALLSLNAGVWTALPGAGAVQRLEVIFFDVGQGDAALVLTPSRRAILIDAGVRYEGYDAGERVVLPHLKRYGIERLDAAIVSHPHSDHLGGLPSLLRALPIHRLVHNVDNYVTSLTRETDGLVDSLGVQRRTAHAGDTLLVDPAVEIRILSPSPELVQGRDVNEASLVLRIRYGETCFLFLGDAGLEAEQEMLRAAPGELACGVVKVGHHGSRTASGPDFLARVLSDTLRPASAIVSVAAENGYGLPDEEVVARWHARGAEVWTTAEQGAVWLRSDGKEVQRVDWR